MSKVIPMFETECVKFGSGYRVDVSSRDSGPFITLGDAESVERLLNQSVHMLNVLKLIYAKHTLTSLELPRLTHRDLAAVEDVIANAMGDS